MRHSHHMVRPRSGECGSEMIEAVICMLLICLILFGLLQVFYSAAAQMVTDYSAFRAARSETVGFREDLVEREGKLKAIAASGRMRFPIDMTSESTGSYPFSSAIGQFYWERLAIIDYMEMRRTLKYEYWHPEYNVNENHSTSYTVTSASQGDTFTAYAKFLDYPWIMPMRRAFVSDEKLNIEGKAELSKQSTMYLE